MKRSEINVIMMDSLRMIRRMGFVLPPFSKWSVDDFRAHPDHRRIRDRRMGWDITDYGQGRFKELGLFLFTLRNGTLAELNAGRGMVYAEKLLISRGQQVSPMHTHRHKVEDIINRGGGTLVIELCGSDDAGNYAPDRGGQVLCDGIVRSYAPHERIALRAGESVTLRPGDWHAFWAESYDVLIGEVSTVNDDVNDNIFVDPIGRFAEIEEDEEPLHLLVSDYDVWLR